MKKTYMNIYIYIYRTNTKYRHRMSDWVQSIGCFPYIDHECDMWVIIDWIMTMHTGVQMMQATEGGNDADSIDEMRLHHFFTSLNSVGESVTTCVAKKKRQECTREGTRMCVCVCVFVCGGGS